MNDDSLTFNYFYNPSLDKETRVLCGLELSNDEYQEIKMGVK